jgi:hypothetical protein
LIESAESGEWTPNRYDDVLTRALGNKEHPGRTRGVGSSVGLRKYFGGYHKEAGGKYMTQHELQDLRASVTQDVTKNVLDFLRASGVVIPERISSMTPPKGAHSSYDPSPEPNHSSTYQPPLHPGTQFTEVYLHF